VIRREKGIEERAPVKSSFGGLQSSISRGKDERPTSNIEHRMGREKEED